MNQKRITNQFLKQKNFTLNSTLNYLFNISNMKKLFSYLLISSMVVLSSCTNYDDQFDDLNTQINALKAQIEGFSSLSTGLTSLQGTVASLQSAVANIPATDLSGLESDLTALSALVESLQTQVAATATALEAGSVSDAAIAAAIKVVQDNQAALDTAVAAVSAAQADLASAADVAAVADAQTAADAAAVKLAAAVADLATELTALGTTNAELKTVTDLIQASVALLTDGQAANTTSIADLVDSVAALDTASLSTLINTLSTAVTSNTEDILAAILAGNNVYTSGSGASALQINSPASLAVAESLGTKLGIINGGVTITHTDATKMDATKLQAVIDNMITVTGAVSYTHSGDAVAVNFSKLSSAGSLEIDAEQAISLAELTTVTGELRVDDDNFVTSFSAPKLTSVGNFNNGTNDDKLTFQRATSIDLSAMASYDNATTLTIGGNALSAGWDLTMPNIQSKSSAGVSRNFTLEIEGYVNLVELDKMVNSGSTITANKAKKIVLDNFLGTLTAANTNEHVNVELGSLKSAYDGGPKLETFKATGVLTSALSTAVGPALDFTSSAKLVSVDVAGEIGAFTIGSNDNVETVTISANAVSVNLQGSTSLTEATISGDVSGAITFDSSTALTTATVSGDSGSISFNANSSLTSVSLTGATKSVKVIDADALTSLDLAHTTGFVVANGADAAAAADKTATLEVTGNAELKTLTADKVTLVGTLKVYSNPNLSSVSFDKITAPASTAAGTRTVHIGATLVGSTATQASNNLIAQSIADGADTVDADDEARKTGTITTDSGLSDLAAYLTAVAKDDATSVYVAFDKVVSYTDKDGNPSSNLVFGAPKTIIANFNTNTNTIKNAVNYPDSKAWPVTGLTAAGLTTIKVEGNGGEFTFTKASTESPSQFIDRINGSTALPNVGIAAGILDKRGVATSGTYTSSAFTATFVLGSSGYSSATVTPTSYTNAMFQVNVGTPTAGDITDNMDDIVDAINTGSITMQSFTASGTYTTTTQKVKDLYRAERNGNNIALYNAKEISTSATATETVLNRVSSTAPLFKAFSDQGIFATTGTVYTATNDFYVKLSDNLYESNTPALDITVGVVGTKGTLITADRAYDSTTGADKFGLTTVAHAGGLTRTEQFKYPGSGSSNATDVSDDPVYNTTYWTWN